MSEAVVAAIITGICAIVAQVIISVRSSRDLYTKLDKQSELADAKLEDRLDKYQAVTDMKIENLTREVAKHNNLVERTYRLEETIKHADRRLAALERNVNAS